MIRLIFGLIMFPVAFVVSYVWRLLWSDIVAPLVKFALCICTFRLVSACISLGLWLVKLVIDIPLGLLASLGTAARISFGGR